MTRRYLLCAIGLVTACGGKPAPAQPAMAGSVAEPPAALAAVDPTDAIDARVNGQPIARSEVDRRIGVEAVAMLEATADADERAYLLATKRMEQLQQLIDERLVIAAATRDGVVVEAADVDAAITIIKTSNHYSDADLERQLVASKYTMAAYREDVRQQLLIQRYLRVKAIPDRSSTEVQAMIAAAERTSATIAVTLVVPPKPSSLAMQLDISRVLEPGDLKSVLKRDIPGFEAERMSTPERSRTADTLHFKALGKEETFDVAVRVWRGPSEITDEAWAALLTLPNSVKDSKPVGTESFAAHDLEIKVFGYGFRDLPQRTVVLVTCGEDLCHTAAETLAIAQLVQSRLTRITVQKL